MRAVWLLALLLAAGCAETGKQAESGSAGGSTATGEQKIESQPLKYLKNRNHQAAADAPAQCARQVLDPGCDRHDAAP